MFNLNQAESYLKGEFVKFSLIFERFFSLTYIEINNSKLHSVYIKMPGN